ILIDYAGVSAVVNELERNIKIDDKILKFMTVLKAEAVNPAALESEIAEAANKGEKEAPLAAAAEEPATGEDEALPPVPEETDSDAKVEMES
ncbi:MAG: 30S ribosomal protein S6, partial [Proteobacteria bacterium]|nr:30S ribosomal protein S6 [Pseudomonadota bacterium]